MRLKIPPLFLKKEKLENYLVLDIGTEAVKAVIIKKDPRPVTAPKKIVILGSSLEYFDQFGVFDSRDFETDIIKKAISRAIEEIERKAKIKPSSVFLGLPANILRGRIVFQNLKRKNKKEIITKAEEGRIYEEVLKRAKKDLSRKFFQETGILPEDICFCNLKILEIEIDGYEVSTTLGFGGQNLDFKILATYLPKYYLENIKKVFKDSNLKIFKTVHQIENLPFILSNEKSNAIFLDIGGEITQIFLASKGKIEGIYEFQDGGVSFTKKISQILGLNFQDARFLKHDYSKRILSEELRKRIREIFSEDLQIWFGNLKKTLMQIFLTEKKGLLPSTIFLFGGGSDLPEIQEILEEGNWQDIPFTSQPKAKLILPKDFENIEDRSQALLNPQLTPSILISLS